MGNNEKFIEACKNLRLNKKKLTLAKRKLKSAQKDFNRLEDLVDEGESVSFIHDGVAIYQRGSIMEGHVYYSRLDSHRSFSIWKCVNSGGYGADFKSSIGDFPRTVGILFRSYAKLRAAGLRFLVDATKRGEKEFLEYGKRAKCVTPKSRIQ